MFFICSDPFIIFTLSKDSIGESKRICLGLFLVFLIVYSFNGDMNFFKLADKVAIFGLRNVYLTKSEFNDLNFSFIICYS